MQQDLATLLFLTIGMTFLHVTSIEFNAILSNNVSLINFKNSSKTLKLYDYLGQDLLRIELLPSSLDLNIPHK
jgi:hypothetical protein